jgi:NDP-sugar pyrophosphorylase family protein
MRALILAAGWATRMGALAEDRPKHLLPIGGRGAVDWVAEALDAVPEVARIDLLTHERFRPAFEAWSRGRRARRAPLRVWGNGVVRFQDRRGAVADLAWFVKRARIREDLLVLGGDQVIDGDLRPLARAARRQATLAWVEVGDRERVSRYASIELDADGRVEKVVEKDPAPRDSRAVPAIYGLPARLLPEVERYLAEGGAPDNLGWLAEWLVRHHPVRGERLDGRWLDVGHPDEYERACRELGAAPSAPADGPPGLAPPSRRR